MLPRTHTWLHLLPRDASFECRSGPQWLRGALEERSCADGHRIRVGFEKPPDSDGADAIVAINTPAPAQSVLKDFKHVRRYAVLPGWDNPRWFIPLENPSISSAAFDLYTPARVTARFKRVAARAVVHSRLPVWYRDHLLIAQREAPPIERAMTEIFPGSDVFIALSAGAPEGARNRKASAAVIDADGDILAFLKMAGSELSGQLLRHEAQILGELPVQLRADEIAPQLLYAGEIDGGYVTAQKPLSGRPAPATFGPMHAAFLKRLSPRNAVSPMDTQFVQCLPNRIAALGQPSPDLTDALEQARGELADFSVSAGVVHGDFAPWNLRRSGKTIRAFDWEYASLDAPAGIDQIHYRLQIGFLLENWTIDRAAHELKRPQSASDSIHPGMTLLYLVDAITRLLGEGYDQTNDMVAWHMRLLAQVRRQSAREAAVA